MTIGLGPMAGPLENPPLSPWREKLRVIIFEADTPAGKAFDVGLLLAICLSVLAVMLDSVITFRGEHGRLLNRAEWIFTLIFSVEYVLRLICSPHPLRYARSFFGVSRSARDSPNLSEPAAPQVRSR